MKLEPISLFRSNASTPSAPSSKLDQLMQISQNSASAAEKRKMARMMQMQMEQESVGTLFAHIPEIKGKAEKPSKEDAENGDKVSNEHGDTVQISDTAKQQFETSRSESGGSAPEPAATSSPAT
ncbi:hypothetical protein LBW89_06605 [Paenibacillus sp. alder61]|uniref:Uncharacterized protein n=1 Tax=Paenibacillus faecis TaxID=862114 RepID=A0A5D0CP63_9BACL|nr:MULTISPECIES: hypothetical protein [Paenibacillus]MCA1292682.1 hypothetical protein [Paenibacillus sp. alder61]TYA10487.1 hypothetical protein FRY98_21975 [Paenibacillus faecis]